MHAPIAEVGLIHGSGFEVVDGGFCLGDGSRFNAEKAAQLLGDGSIEKVICSGRGPVQGEEYATSEARLMADHLVNAGVASSQIEVEDGSTSSLGNWTMSVPVLSELNATSVIGVASSACVGRLELIADFVAAQSDFEFVGYCPSEEEVTMKCFTRELINRNLMRHFLTANADTPIELLSDAYEAYKARLGLVTLKKLLHRKLANTD
jgi:hypothetical protein